MKNESEFIQYIIDKFPKPILEFIHKCNLLKMHHIGKLNELKFFCDYYDGNKYSYFFDSIRNFNWVNSLSQFSKNYTIFFYPVISCKSKNEYESLVSEICQEANGEYFENKVRVPRICFATFVKTFGDTKSINWKEVSKDPNLPWTRNLITAYKDVWNWEQLSANKGVPWSFNLIEDNIEKVHFGQLINNEHLNWGIDEIDKYKSNLHWTNINNRSLSNAPRTVYNYPLKSDINNASVSFSKRIDWSIELIDMFSDLIDWKELSMNESIKWSLDKIVRFQNKIDFNFLSSNKTVVWNEETIKSFEEKWNWHYLSFNPSIKWDHDLLSKFEDKIVWDVKNNLKGGNSTYKNIGGEYLDDYSLCTNFGMTWNLLIIDKYFNILDLWRICKHSRKIDIDVFLKYKNIFDQEYAYGTKHHKHSDWFDEETLFQTGWGNIGDNTNFEISIDLLNALKNSYTIITKSEGDARSGFEYSKADCKIIDCIYLKNKSISDTDIIKIMESPEEWHNIFYDSNFIHNTLLEKIFRPFFTIQNNVERFINLHLSRL